MNRFYFAGGQEVTPDIFLLGIKKTENFRKNTNYAPPALPFRNASALWYSRGVHNKEKVRLCP